MELKECMHPLKMEEKRREGAPGTWWLSTCNDKQHKKTNKKRTM